MLVIASGQELGQGSELGDLGQQISARLFAGFEGIAAKAGGRIARVDDTALRGKRNEFTDPKLGDLFHQEHFPVALGERGGQGDPDRKNAWHKSLRTEFDPRFSFEDLLDHPVGFVAQAIE